MQMTNLVPWSGPQVIDLCQPSESNEWVKGQFSQLMTYIQAFVFGQSPKDDGNHLGETLNPPTSVPFHFQ